MYPIELSIGLAGHNAKMTISKWCWGQIDKEKIHSEKMVVDEMGIYSSLLFETLLWCFTKLPNKTNVSQHEIYDDMKENWKQKFFKLFNADA